MLRAVTIAAAISLASRCACAAPPSVPQEVAAHIEKMNQLCREDGGTPIAPKADFLVSGKLRGNGFTDWAIDEGGFNCDGAWSIFNGSGGAQIYVFAGTPGNRAQLSFVHGAYRMRVERGNGHDMLWLAVGGQLCGQPGHPSHADAVTCERPLIWNSVAHKFDFRPLSTIKGISKPKTP